ncbi:ankyrin repeat domain-containing protein [Wolbachia endosymbiont (group E) of Neria commutata]|uniref:ankyrin repeat domain-containing protein n=1 Tax=Wolbachia endosymbiont (group E) of Neria commutata TaxID=3066149 RepID=UPI0031331E7B
MTILDHAAENGLVDVVGLLCAIGADVNHISDNGFTPIFLAIIGAKDENESDVLNIVQLLCNSGADVNYVNKDKDSEYIGFTPMRTAIEKRSSGIVKVLCENGADIFVFVNDIMVKTLRKDRKEVFYFKDNLKEKGCSPKKGGVSPPKKDQGYKCFDSVLHFAARTGETELILSCIENLRKKIPNQYKGSGFHTSRHKLSLEMLLNMKDINGKTALDLAESNSPEVAKMLKEELNKLKRPAYSMFVGKGAPVVSHSNYDMMR